MFVLDFKKHFRCRITRKNKVNFVFLFAVFKEQLQGNNCPERSKLAFWNSRQVKRSNLILVSYSSFLKTVVHFQTCNLRLTDLWTLHLVHNDVAVNVINEQLLNSVVTPSLGSQRRRNERHQWIAVNFTIEENLWISFQGRLVFF